MASTQRAIEAQTVMLKALKSAFHAMDAAPVGIGEHDSDGESTAPKDTNSTLIPSFYKLLVAEKGAVTQTLLAQVDIIIHHKEINNINLFVRRSFSEHLMSWINDAASRL